jgi:hypothetical protein
MTICQVFHTYIKTNDTHLCNDSIYQWLQSKVYIIIVIALVHCLSVVAEIRVPALV